MKTATCRSCGAAIVWAVTPAGKNTPIDAAPSLMGRFSLVQGPGNGPPLAEVVRSEPDYRPLYTSHFATCPDAARHRRPRAGV